MKLNYNKIIFMLLLCIGIALGCFASAISLLTANIWLEVFLLVVTYFLGMYLVKTVHKYPIIIKKEKK